MEVDRVNAISGFSKDTSGIPETPFVKYLRSNPKLERIDADVIFPHLSDVDIRYALGFRGKPFSRVYKSTIYWDPEANKLLAAVQFPPSCEGRPGCVHGGALATAVDSCLGWTANRQYGSGYVTLYLNVTYKKLVPVEKEGKKLVIDAKILNDAGDTLYTEVTSMFYRVDETYLDWQTMKKTIGNESGLTKEQFLARLKEVEKQRKKKAPLDAKAKL